MTAFLRAFAYFCIYTTPLQIIFLLWILWVVLQSGHSIMSLSMEDFLRTQLPFLREWVRSYLSFFSPWFNFWWAFPAAFIVTMKTLINAWLGFWILKKIE